VPDLSDLVGSEIRRLLLDHQVTLFLAKGPRGSASMTAQVIIDAPFRLDQGGRVDEVDPNRKETLPPLCRLLHAAVADTSIDENVLTISLDEGTTITIGPLAGGASWELVGPGIPHLVAGPLDPGGP